MRSRREVSRRVSLLVAVSLGLLTAVGCVAMRGSGWAKLEQRPLTDFREVHVSGPIDVEVFEGGEGYRVQILGDDNLVSNVDTRVANGRLDIVVTGSFSTKVPLEAKIWMPKLENRGSSNSGNIVVKQAAPKPTLGMKSAR